MSSKTGMNRNVVPNDFTLALVLVDAIPVLLFAMNMVMIGLLLDSYVFMFGALLCLYAGATKVLWKLIVVLKKRNIWWMFVQMRYVMPIGFIMMIISFVLNISNIGLAFQLFLKMPAIIFFVIGVLGMMAMMLFMFKLDSSDVKANWIEQITNGIAQGSFFIGLLLVILGR